MFTKEQLLPYRIELSSFDVDRKPPEIDKMQTQTAWNCWLYSALNNLYANTGVYLDWEMMENYIESKWYDADSWSRPIFSSLVICDYLENYELCAYEINLVKKIKKFYTPFDFDINSIKLFKKLLDNWVMFQYIRKSWADLYQDIKQDDIVDYPISDKNMWLHATNLISNWKKWIEIGSRGDDSIYNVFSYKSYFTFLFSVMKWTIEPVVRFIYPKQKRPYTDWRNKVLWWRVDYDWAYWFQCVDLFKEYMHRVLWEPQWKVGNANEIRYNKYLCFWDWWYRLEWTGNLMQWDVIVSLQWKNWHIWVVNNMPSKDRISVIEQNWSWSAAVNWTNWDEIRVQDYSNSYWAWVWRNKKIEQNYQKEVDYVINKIKTEWEDEETMNYLRSTRRM